MTNTRLFFRSSQFYEKKVNWKFYSTSNLSWTLLFISFFLKAFTESTSYKHNWLCFIVERIFNQSFYSLWKSSIPLNIFCSNFVPQIVFIDFISNNSTTNQAFYQLYSMFVFAMRKNRINCVELWVKSILFWYHYNL